jgi:RNA polymerase sigma-70 factor (ECF subfamily)
MSNTEFHQLLIDSSRTLKTFAISFTHDHEEAKDLLQETLTRALENKEKYCEVTNIKAWLYTVMHNIFINNCRRKKNKKKHSCHSAQASSKNDPPGSFYHQAESLEVKEMLSVLHSLPDTFRIPIWLAIEGYNYQEIADILSVAVGTIKSRIHFGRKRIRQKVE